MNQQNPNNLTFKEKKERCEKCKYARQSKSSSWAWPCDECLGAVATLVKPVKDYYEEVK